MVSLLTPENNAFAGIPTTLTWQALAGAELYRVVVGTDEELVNKVIDTVVVETDFTTVQDLLEGTDYWWQISKAEIRDTLSLSDSTILFSSITTDTLTVEFAQAEDEQEQVLTYELYISTSDNISTLEDVLANGTLASTAQNVNNLTAGNLDEQTQYWVNVLVKNSLIGREVYTSTDGTTVTIGGSESPVLGDSNLIIANQTADSFTLQFVQAVDNDTPQENLIYKLYVGNPDDDTTDENGELVDNSSVDTLANINTNGTLVATGTGVNKLTASNQQGSILKANVTVEDAAGNRSIYNQITVILSEAEVLSVTINEQFDYVDQTAGTVQLSADIIVNGGADTTINWISSNNQIATVDQSGLVTFVTAGQVTIKAESNFDNSKFDELTFNIYEITAPSEEWEFTTA